MNVHCKNCILGNLEKKKQALNHTDKIKVNKIIILGSFLSAVSIIRLNPCDQMKLLQYNAEEQTLTVPCYATGSC